MGLNNIMQVKKYHIKTWGCQMNEYDSKKMYTILNDLGLYESEDINNSDIIIINDLRNL
mgnify:CR=1 FL=1